MLIKHVLVYVDTDTGCEARVHLAAELASRSDALLTGLYVKRVPNMPAYATMDVPASVAAEYETLSDEKTESVRREFEGYVNGMSVTSEWCAVEGYPPDVVAEHARYVDLVVLGQAHDTKLKFHQHYDPASILLRVTVPVLIVPSAGTPTLPRRHAVIAWNNTRESARAVRDALPLLAYMDKTTVLRISKSGQDDIPGDAVSAYLTRHGVDVEYVLKPREGKSVGEVVLSHATESGSDLIVMGGYGHSRVFETVLGGMTHYMLSNMVVPVLMSH